MDNFQYVGASADLKGGKVHKRRSTGTVVQSGVVQSFELGNACVWF